MKLKLTILLLVCIISTSYSQIIPKPQSLKDFSTWSITPIGALTYENMDFEENDPLFKKTPVNYGLGLEINKQLSHFFSVQLNGFNTKLETNWMEYKFKTNIRQLDFRFRLNMTNGAIFRKWQNTQLYLYTGYGMIMYDAARYDRFTNKKLYKITDITRVIPLGLGFKNRLGNRTSISADLSYNQTNTDNMDTWSDAKTDRDGYTRITVGLTYNLGKKKPLEWDYPWMYLVPSVVNDTTVIVSRIESIPIKTEPDTVILDSTVIYYFADNYQVEHSYIKDLDYILERARNEKYCIEIQAYCDSSGTRDGNIKLVDLRAKKVADYAKKYISEEEIFIIKYNESAAIFLPEARNRKVIVKLIK